MFYPRLQKPNYKLERIINNPGDGVNTYGTPSSISASEARKAINLCSRKLPALCVREGRVKVAPKITTPNILGERGNEVLNVLDGTTWKQLKNGEWEDIETGLTSAPGKIFDFVRGTDRNTILVNGSECYAWDGTSAVGLNQAPLTDKFISHSGRLYALRDATLKYSALNLITDWTTANDAGTVEITTAKGSGTGIVSYGGYVIVFTEFSMHQLYGTGPTNYTLSEVPGSTGTISDKSIVICNDTLYFVSFDGLYSFRGGSSPVKVSSKADEYFRNMNLSHKRKIVCGSIDNRIYISIPSKSTSTGNDLILRYDVLEDKWYPASGNVVSFTTIGNTLYGLEKDGNLWNMKSGTKDETTPINWYWESGVRVSKPSSKQTLSELWITYDLPVDSSLNIYTSNSFDDDDKWNLNASIVPNATEQNTRILIPLTQINDANWYRIKLVGAGPCTIHSIEELYRVRE